MLTVVRLAGRNSSKHLRWECLCECGNASIHTGNNLRCGHARSCGCLKKKRTYRKNLVGKTFGKLRVVGEGPTRNGIAFWQCECSCGNTCSISTGHLTTLHTQSCGCYLSEVSRKLAYKYLAGKKKVSPNGSLPPRRLKEGYVRIHDRTHPRADKSGFVLEHIVVMEKHIKRHVVLGETVHHINGIRDDNRISNLELWSSSHPCGQRVKDKVAWAVSFLKQYAPNKLK